MKKYNNISFTSSLNKPRELEKLKDLGLNNNAAGQEFHEQAKALGFSLKDNNSNFYTINPLTITTRHFPPAIRH